MAQRDRTRDPQRRAEIDVELRLPPFPEELRYLWQAYLRLRNRMAPGFGGAVPIGWTDIDAFTRNSRMVLAPWEVEVLESVDDAFMSSGG